MPDASTNHGAADVWEYCIALYQAPMISETVLALQDQFAVDVNILLFACWFAGFDGGRLTPDGAGDLVDTTRGWQRDVVARLRQARRAMPRTTEHEALRGRILDAELAAEKLEIETLATTFPAPGPRLAGDAAIADTARHNLRTCLTCYGVTAEDEATAVERIAEAAAAIHERETRD